MRGDTLTDVAIDLVGRKLCPDLPWSRRRRKVRFFFLSIGLALLVSGTFGWGLWLLNAKGRG